jgi:hypothetical protein
MILLSHNNRLMLAINLVYLIQFFIYLKYGKKSS